MTFGLTITEWFSAWSCVILLGTAILIWWYTKETKKLRIEANNQAQTTIEILKVAQKQTEISNKQFEIARLEFIKTFRNGFIDVEVFPLDKGEIPILFYVNKKVKNLTTFTFIEGSSLITCRDFDSKSFVDEINREKKKILNFKIIKENIPLLKDPNNIPFSFLYETDTRDFHIQHFLYNMKQEIIEETLLLDEKLKKR